MQTEKSYVFLLIFEMFVVLILLLSFFRRIIDYLFIDIKNRYQLAGTKRAKRAMYSSEHLLYSGIKFISLLAMTSLLFAILLIVPPLTENKDESDVSVRIEKITNSLAEISTEISSVQVELEKRIELVEQLKTEAEIAENMISLSDEQVSAIQSKLNEELNANSTKSFLQSILANALFFVLGLLIPLISKWFKRKWVPQEDQSEVDETSQTTISLTDLELKEIINKAISEYEHNSNQ